MDDRHESVRLVMPLGKTALGECYFISQAHIRPLTPVEPWKAEVRRRVSDYRMRAADRGYRASAGLDPEARRSERTVRPLIGAWESAPSIRSIEPRAASRLWRWLLLFLAACALVSRLTPPWDLILALSLLAVALVWASLGLHRVMPPEGRGRTR